MYRYATTRHFELLNDDDPDLKGSNMLNTTMIKETERPQLFTLLHADGTPSAIQVTPHPDGFTLHISMGHGKVLHGQTGTGNEVVDLRARLAAFAPDCVAHGMTPSAERSCWRFSTTKQTRKYINAWEARFKKGAEGKWHNTIHRTH